MLRDDNKLSFIQYSYNLDIITKYYVGFTVDYQCCVIMIDDHSYNIYTIFFSGLPILPDNDK